MELKTFFAQDLMGNVIPSPTVTVYIPGTTTIATGLEDANGNALTNPFSGDGNGKVVLAAPDGDYDLKVEGAGRTTTMRVRFIDASFGSAQALRDDLAADGGAELVGFTPAAGILGASVQAALEWLGANKASLTALAAANGASLIGHDPTGTGSFLTNVQDKLREFRTFKDFGAVGDGVADDSDAIEEAIASNADVYDDMRGSTYRITRQINIPNSCFTKFRGVGNVPVPKSKFFVDFSGVAFKGAVGTTSFFCIKDFYCYSLPAHTNSQLVDHDGDCVHSRFERLVLFNFKKIAIDLASAFRCNIEFLGQYCWDYMLKIGIGSATNIKFTADHSYAGGIDINGSGFVINPYTEMICSDNNPAGANASWREMIIRGGLHTIIGGLLSVHPQNNKFPIELAAARAITFTGTRGFSLGAAPHWVNLNANDSSVTAIDCPDFTYGGTTTNLVIIDPGYTTTPPDIKSGGNSMRVISARVWCCFDGTTGTNKQANGISGVVRNSTGNYTISWPSGTFQNTNYAVNITAQNSGSVCVGNLLSKTLTSVTISVNNTASTAGYDSPDVSVTVFGY